MKNTAISTLQCATVLTGKVVHLLLEKLDLFYSFIRLSTGNMDFRTLITFRH